MSYPGNVSRDYLNPVQAALFKRLSGLKLLSLEGKDCAVYDEPPDDAKFPMVFIGEQTQLGQFSTKTEAGAEIEVLLVVRSRNPSNKEVNALSGTIISSLTGTPLDMSADQLSIVHQKLTVSRVGKISGWGSVREVRLNIKVEDLSTVQPHT